MRKSHYNIFYIFLLLFNGWFNTAFCQAIDIDSLKTVVAMSNADSNEVEVLKELGDYYEGNSDSVLFYYNKALVLSQQIHANVLEKKENKIIELKTKKIEQDKNVESLEFNNKLLGATLFVMFLSLSLCLYWNKVSDLRKINELRIRLSKDLHDNIGASLNHIKMLSSRLNNNNISKEEREKDINRIKKISNEMIYNMHDMIWSLDKKKETVANLLERMQDHVDNVRSDFNIPIQFKVGEINESNKLKTKEKVNIYLLFKEAINNILKHTEPESVKIDFANDNARYFKMTIINFYKTKKEKENLSNSKGINNMKIRAQEIGGVVKVLDKRNSFIVEFIL